MYFIIVTVLFKWQCCATLGADMSGQVIRLSLQAIRMGTGGPVRRLGRLSAAAEAGMWWQRSVAGFGTGDDEVRPDFVSFFHLRFGWPCELDRVVEHLSKGPRCVCSILVHVICACLDDV